MVYQPFQHLYSHIKASDPRLYEALDRMSMNLQKITNSISTSSVSSGNTSASLYLFVTLTANITVASPIAPINGILLIVKLLQDSTGGWTTAWDSSFKTVPNLGSLDPLTYSVITFIGDSGKWWVVSLSLNQAQ